KKMLLLLAGMACLGMFVSCSDDPQEVAVVEVAYEAKLVGYASGTIVGSSYNVNTTRWATLTYDKVTEGCRDYELKVPYGSSGSDYIFIREIDGKYYDKSTETLIDVKGSVSGGDFTVSAITGNNNTYTNLSFKKGVTK
ncbi:MAG: hypothetical protein K2K67_00525, partial [Treponemataceae bacterium]|nr:hypothetical protein [Treponemataceae bacterium]